MFLAIALIIGLILLAAWLGRTANNDQTLGTGREPEQKLADPDWRPSKIKGQGGGPFG